MRRLSAALFLLILSQTAASVCSAADIEGKVVDAADNIVRIATDSDLLPRAGDAVEIYFLIPGLSDPVQVGTGKVIDVTAQYISAKIESPKSKLARNQLARVASPSPRPRGALASPSSGTTLPPSATGNVAPPTVAQPKSAAGEIRTITGMQFVNALAFSGDGHEVLACGSGFRRWDAASGTLIKQFDFADPVPIVAAISSDGTRLLTGDNECVVKLWDFERGQELKRFAGHTTWINNVALSRDGKRAASCAGVRELREVSEPGAAAPVREVSDDCTVRVWDVETGSELRKFDQHLAPVTSVTFSPNGLYVLSTSSDRTSRLWDIRAGQERQRFAEKSYVAVQDAAISRDGLRIVTLSHGEAPLDGEVAPFPSNRFIKNSNDDAAPSDPDGGTCSALRLWDQNGGAMLHKLGEECEGFARCGEITPDGRRLVVGTSNGRLRIFDLQSGTEQSVFAGHSGQVVSLAVSPDGRRVLSADSEGTIKLWGLPN